MYVYVYVSCKQRTVQNKESDETKSVRAHRQRIAIIYSIVVILYQLVMVRSFEVTFSGDRSSKKRKVFHDGCLTVQEDPFRVSLLTEDRQKTIFTSGNPKDRTHISLGAEITLGVYSVNISVEESAKIRPCTHTASRALRRS